MKLKSTIITFLIFFTACLSSCEKHEGISYFKSKCTAELNGQSYIDQTRFNFSPNAINTPSLIHSEDYAEFKSMLRKERDGDIFYGVEIIIFVDTPWAYLTKAQTFKEINIEYSDDQHYLWEYSQYCHENKISYARITSFSTLTSGIVSDGTFQITSYDNEKNHYTGTFTLNFSEGTLSGEFNIN